MFMTLRGILSEMEEISTPKKPLPPQAFVTLIDLLLKPKAQPHNLPLTSRKKKTQSSKKDFRALLIR